MESLRQEHTWKKKHLFFWFVFLLFLHYNTERRDFLGYLKAWLGSSAGIGFYGVISLVPLVIITWTYSLLLTLIFARNWRLIRWTPQSAIIYSLKLEGVVWEKGYSIAGVCIAVQEWNVLKSLRAKGSWTLEFLHLRMLHFMIFTFWGRFLQNLRSHEWEGKVSSACTIELELNSFIVST